MVPKFWARHLIKHHPLLSFGQAIPSTQRGAAELLGGSARGETAPPLDTLPARLSNKVAAK